MEGMQYLQHRVIDGVYQAVLYWKVAEGKVYIQELGEWIPTLIPVRFVKDFELDAVGISLGGKVTDERKGSKRARTDGQGRYI